MKEPFVLIMSILCIIFGIYGIVMSVLFRLIKIPRFLVGCQTFSNQTVNIILTLAVSVFLICGGVSTLFMLQK